MPLLVVTAAAPAGAHGEDPRESTVIDRISPPLPPGVLLQAVDGIAPQLAAENPTVTPLQVLGRNGAPFLQIARDGVLADPADPEFLASEVPAGPPPGPLGPHRLVPISRGDGWGWFDRRLPTGPGRFVIPLRYGAEPVTVSGHVTLTPLTGGLLVTADPTPAGVTVGVLQGALPGLFLTVAPGVALTVFSRTGEAFLRFTGTTAEVNRSSTTWREDRLARGLAPRAPSARADFEPLSGRSIDWLDVRLRVAEPTAAGPERVVARWSIPVSRDGHRTALTGVTRWVPVAPADAHGRSGARTTEATPFARRLAPAAALAAAALVAALAATPRRARRSRP